MFTEMQAAIGNIQLKKLNKILKKKKQIFDTYKINLKHINQIKFLKPIKKNEPVHWFSNIIAKDKKKLKSYLFKNGIQTRDFFMPLNNQPCFLKTNLIKNKDSKFPISDYLYRFGLSLPSSYDLSKKQIFYISKKIKEFYQNPEKKL